MQTRILGGQKRMLENIRKSQNVELLSKINNQT